MKKIETHHYQMTVSLYMQFLEALAQLRVAFNHSWFVKELRDKKLFPYLEYVSPSQIVEAYHSIMFAFKNAGTTEALIGLSRAFFGSNCTIEFTILGPNHFSMKIVNANRRLLYALKINNNNEAFALHANASSRQFSLLAKHFDKGLALDPLSFFRNFVAAGVILENIEIS